jgi:hypothetical protein
MVAPMLAIELIVMRAMYSISQQAEIHQMKKLLQGE